jgi:hypothetical protein
MLLAFEPAAPCGQAVNGLVPSGTRTIVPSGTPSSCYREPKPRSTTCTTQENRALNLESNKDSNLEERRTAVETLISRTGAALKARHRHRGSGGDAASAKEPELPLGKPGAPP